MQDSKSVLIVGGGISGCAAAKSLSTAGATVYLLEKELQIGGHVRDMGCKATEQCLRCNVCMGNEVLRDVEADPSINVMAGANLVSLNKNDDGKFTAVIEQTPEYIDAEKCVTCQGCVSICPTKCIKPNILGGSKSVPTIDYSDCKLNKGKECGLCEEICPTKAIKMNRKAKPVELTVDSVVLATGHDAFDPSIVEAYGYGRGCNVITGEDAEKQLADNCKLTRPSDNCTPKHLAFIQCIGSRSEQIHRGPEDTNYCSAVCCSYALRMAKLAKHIDAESEVTVFYMDIQNFGKGFNEFYNECKDSIEFIRSRPHQISHNSDGTVTIKYAPQCVDDNPDTGVSEKEFDMVVLSVGIRPRTETQCIANELGIAVDSSGFFGLKNASAMPELYENNIYVTGTCEGPKDIKDSITQARAVATQVLSS